MRIVSRTTEGKKWERQFKKLTQRLYDYQKVVRNANANFSLETCPYCENLKRIGERCPECKNEDIP